MEKLRMLAVAAQRSWKRGIAPTRERRQGKARRRTADVTRAPPQGLLVAVDDLGAEPTVPVRSYCAVVTVAAAPSWSPELTPSVNWPLHVVDEEGGAELEAHPVLR